MQNIQHAAGKTAMSIGPATLNAEASKRYKELSAEEKKSISGVTTEVTLTRSKILKKGARIFQKMQHLVSNHA